MLLKTLHSGKLLVYVTLSFADLYLTYSLVQRNHGIVYEFNPIANAWLASYGWAGLATFKITAVLLVGGLVAYISVYRPLVANRVLGFACCAVAFVVVYSCWLMSVVPSRSPDLAENEFGPPSFAVAYSHAKPTRVSDQPHVQFRQLPRTPVLPSDVPGASVKSGGHSPGAVPVSFDLRPATAVAAQH
jgi:hypothetical protein